MSDEESLAEESDPGGLSGGRPQGFEVGEHQSPVLFVPLRGAELEENRQRIGDAVDRLFPELGGRRGAVRGACRDGVFTQASGCDELFENDVYDIEDTVEQGKELLLKLLRAESTPPEWKRAVLDELEIVCQKGERSQFGYFAMEFFLKDVSVLVLTEAELKQRQEA